MINRLKQLWIGSTTSFWFIPAIINITLIIVAIIVIRADNFLAASQGRFPIEMISFKQELIKTFLATIAGSMITVTGVVFSITILVLAQTAGQYTPRVLRNFMRNKTNQVILGIFLGIFIFCLFLITSLHPKGNFFTTLSGFILALIGIGFLIYYIHQTSISIQATEILRNIQEETFHGIEKLYPNNYVEKETPKINVEFYFKIFW